MITCRQSRGEYIGSFLFDRILRKLLSISEKRRVGNLEFFISPFDHIGQVILTSGLYERHLLQSIGSIARRGGLGGGVVVDVGSNLGNHAVYLSTLFSKVVAFEPNPAVYKLLEANVLLNRRANIVTADFGLADRNGELEFFENQDGNLGGSGFLAPQSSGRYRTSRLKVRIGDEALAELMGPGEKVELMKIDVEGFEEQVLKGLRGTIALHSPLVLFECGDAAQAKNVSSLLRDAGYTHFYSIEPKSYDYHAHPLKKVFDRLIYGADFHLRELTQFADKFYSLLLASKNGLAASPRPTGTCPSLWTSGRASRLARGQSSWTSLSRYCPVACDR